LPLDLDLAHKHQKTRELAISRINEIIDLSICLNPTAFIVHIYKHEEPDLLAWKERTLGSLRKIVCPPDLLSIETLDYDLSELDDVIRLQDDSNRESGRINAEHKQAQV